MVIFLYLILFYFFPALLDEINFILKGSQLSSDNIVNVLDKLADRLKMGLTLLMEDSWFQSKINLLSEHSVLAIYDLLADEENELSIEDILGSETLPEDLMEVDGSYIPDPPTPPFETSLGANLQRLGSVGQGAHQKTIHLQDHQHDRTEDESEQAEGIFQLEIIPSHENVVKITELTSSAEDYPDDPEDLFPPGDMTISELDEQFDQTLNELIMYYGGSTTKFKRPRLVLLNKKERENLLKVYDFQITKEKREQLDKIFKRNLAFIKTFEVMNRRIQSFLLKPFRLFSENL